MVKREKVCVALSGGVDSGVSAYLLKQAGYDVFGAFIKVWQPDFLDCSQEEDRISAKRVAAALNIPFEVVDLSDIYKRRIVDDFVDSYSRGETPNPDVSCNKIVKFGALWDWAKDNGAEKIATGHYAQIALRDGSHQLTKAHDETKDQSYFLWELPQMILSETLLPIGHLKKSEVRNIAHKAGLHVATKKDSQGLCFMGMLDMQEFLHKMLPEKRMDGNVLDAEGRIIGTHTGALTYTIGQRHNFKLTVPVQKSHYVTAINVKENTITIGEITDTRKNKVRLRACVWRCTVVSHKKYTAQIRYHGEYSTVTIELDNDGARVLFDSPQTVSSGQSCVVYDNDVCIGGGIVTT